MDKFCVCLPASRTACSLKFVSAVLLPPATVTRNQRKRVAGVLPNGQGASCDCGPGLLKFHKQHTVKNCSTRPVLLVPVGPSTTWTAPSS